jgi:hypothetical protein
MDEPQSAWASPPAPPEPPSRRFGRGAVAGIFAAGLAIGVILAGLGVAIAQSSSPPSPAPSAGTPPTSPVPGLHRGFGGGCFGHFGFGGVLHGEFTTPAPNGGYHTLAVQTGQVTSVGATSIAVKSEDGFTRTYSVDGNTLVVAGDNGISDVKTGNTVRIVAVVSGGRARAVQIFDATTAQQSLGRWLPRYPKTSPSESQSAASA